MTWEAFAPAKVNLFLHVGSRQADGLHALCSLAVFADVGDRLRVRAADLTTFRLRGPFARLLEAESDSENLVMRALTLLRARAAMRLPGLEVELEKRLPVAAGLGGGSADAAALLRTLNLALGLGLNRQALRQLAGELGSDVPMCLDSSPCVATGSGGTLAPAPCLPPLAAVLVNPGCGVSTGAVYNAYDTCEPRQADLPVWPKATAGARELAEFLSAATRNDLEAPACSIEPQIRATLRLLRAAPETLMVRMSGSGATCFALCEDVSAATAFAARLTDAQPGWWIQPCRLGGPWTETPAA